MLVVIPTYRRIESLQWTLLSLMHTKLPSTGSERFMICIANNHPESAHKTHLVVDNVRQQFTHLPWDWYFLDRKNSIQPIDNWYSAIQDIAEEDEVVFLHGDDDLFTHWGIADRYVEIVQSKADILLSRSVHGLVYVSSKDLYFPNNLPAHKKDQHSCVLSWSDIAGWGPAFIGNHCYRNTNAFRLGLHRAFTWCEEQDWLDRNTRTLMLPYYLPFAIKIIGGQLRGLDCECVIRGRDLDEVLHAPFGVSGWNSGFLALCAYGVLNNADLGAVQSLDVARMGQAEMASSWFSTFYFDKRIQKEIRRQTLQRIKLPSTAWLHLLQLMSIKRTITDRIGLNAWRLRRQAIRRSVSTVSFLDKLVRHS